MAKGPNTRRQPAASMAEIDRLIQGGAYDRVPLDPVGADRMRQRVQNYGGTAPAFGDATGDLRSAYQTDLPDDVYGPQLPDLYMTARNEARNQYKSYAPEDQVGQGISRDRLLHNANMTIATRRAQGVGPDIEWRSGTDAARFMGDKQKLLEAFTPTTQVTPMPTRPVEITRPEEGLELSPDLVRLKMQQKMGRGGI